ncbi:phosphatase PAP2 family protein [Nocardioides marinus]
MSSIPRSRASPDEASLTSGSSCRACWKAVANSVAAMPSLHAGTAVLVSLVLASRATRWWGHLWHLYPLTMCIALVYFAEHYVVDLLAGALLAAGVHHVLGRWERRSA